MSNYSKATTSIVLRKLNSKKSSQSQKLRSINIRVRFIGRTCDWALGIIINDEDYKKIKDGIRLSIELREIRNKINAYKSKADKICNELGENYSNEKFKIEFFNKRLITGGNKSIQSIIVEYCQINPLSIKTKKGYLTLSTHLSNFKQTPTLNEINTHFLNEFKSYLKSKFLSDPTIGIYLRYLKAIYNYSCERKYINNEINPFKNLKIQNSNNKKRPLSKEIIKSLRDYKTDCPKREKARDFFLFSYFSNGINFKDIAMLRYLDINEDVIEGKNVEIISFIRQKTKNTSSNIIKIEFLLKPIHYEIISRCGNNCDETQDGGYIFPILNGEMDEIQTQNKIDQFIKNTNKYLKLISIELGLNFYITTIYARHSFATALKNGNMSEPIIGEALGHQAAKTTRLYLSKSDKKILYQIADIISLD